MYKITLVTNNIKINPKNWEDKLFNDFHKTINGMSWEYKNKKSVIEKINGLAGKATKRLYNGKKNYISLKSKSYGTQKLKIGVYGIAQGYVDVEKRLKDIEKYNNVIIRLSDFYDIRQNNIKILKNGYIKIEIL